MADDDYLSDEYSSDDEEAEETPSRARDLLANYYGKLQGNVEEEVEKETMPAIDRQDFDADAHVREMLETQKLPELLEQDDSLCRDIKSLSGDMQMLVYENYSKFIAATDTIRDMKKHVGAMESEMTSLNATMAEIDGMSAAVNASLADKRAKIDKLVRARRLLKRLEFLFELPRRLSAAAQQKQYKEAVRYYAMTEEILQRYDRVPSLKEIHKECRRIAAKIKTGIRASLDSKIDNDVADIAVRVELLVQLGSDPFDCEHAAFHSTFHSLNVKLSTALSALPKDATPPKIAASIASVVTPAFVQTADALKQVASIVDAAIAKNNLSVEDKERPSLDEHALGLFAEYVEAVEQGLDAAVPRERAALLRKDGDSTSLYVDAARAIEVAGDCVETAAAKCAVGDVLRLKLQRVARRAASRRLEDSMKNAKIIALNAIVGLANSAPSLLNDHVEEEEASEEEEPAPPEDDDEDPAAAVAAALAEGEEEEQKPDEEEEPQPEKEEEEPVVVVKEEEEEEEKLSKKKEKVENAGTVRGASVLAARSVAKAAQAGLERAGPLLDHLDDVDVEDCASDYVSFVRDAIAAAGDVCLPDAKAPEVEVDDDGVSGDRSNIMDPAPTVEALALAAGAEVPTLEKPNAIRVLAVGALARALPWENEEKVRRMASDASSKLSVEDLLDSEVLRRTAAALFLRFSRLVLAEVLRENGKKLFGPPTKEESTPNAAIVAAITKLDAAASDFGAAVGSKAKRLNIEDVLESLDDVAKPTVAPRSVGGIELDVERLFAVRESSHLPSDADPKNLWTPDTLLTSLFTHLLRALIEAVRRLPIPKASHYAQLDLDARFLLAAFHSRLKAHPESITDLERLVTAFLQAASDRCIEDD